MRIVLKLAGRRILIFFLGTLLLLWFGSCEDVVEIETPTEEPRLIVDGLIRVDTTEQFLGVRIKISETSNFFEPIPVTTVDNIVILYEFFEDGLIVGTGSSSLAEETPGTGIYIPDPTFSSDQRISTAIVEFDVLYTLLINYQDRVYASQTRYVPTVPIDQVIQGNNTLFGDEETEAVVTFTDEPDRDDYYVFDFSFNEFLGVEDTFIQGQEFSFSYFYDREFEPGTEVEISILGADQEFYNYMNLLIQQSDDQLDIFSTPVATVRGNVFDVTGLDNIDIVDNVDRPEDFALGYFAIVQEFRDTLLITE